MNRHRSRRARAAFSVLEILVGTFLASLIATLLFQVIGPSLKIGKTVGSKASLLQEARYGMNLLVSDIRGSAGVVSTYGGFHSDAKTLVLRAPSYDGSYRRIVGSYDYIVYRLHGTEPPLRLVRSLYIAPGSARPRQASTDTFIANNVTSVNFVYTARQTVTGDGVNRSYPLLTVRADGALTNLLGSPTAESNGTVQVYDFVIADGLVTFDSPLALGAKVRLLYRVQPEDAEVESLISTVDATLKLGDQDPSLAGPSQPALELTGGASLRNAE